MKYQRKVSITNIAHNMGFIVCNRHFKNNEISCIICDNIDGNLREKAIYLNKYLANSTKRFLVALSLAYYKEHQLHHIKTKTYYKKIYEDDNPNDEIMKNALELILPTNKMLEIMSKEDDIYSKIFLLANSFDIEPQIIYYKLKLLEGSNQKAKQV